VLAGAQVPSSVRAAPPSGGVAARWRRDRAEAQWRA